MTSNSNRDDMRENSDGEGINEDLREFRDQFIRLAEDLFYTHYKKPEIGRSMKPSIRDFQLDRMKNLFTVGQWHFESIDEFMVQQIGWDSYSKDMAMFKYCDKLARDARKNDNTNNMMFDDDDDDDDIKTTSLPPKTSRDKPRRRRHVSASRSRSRSRSRGRNNKSKVICHFT